MGGGKVVLHLFGHLRGALEFLIFVQMTLSRCPRTIVSLRSHLGTRKKKNELTHIRDLSSDKKYKIPRFCRKELETSTVEYSVTLNLMVRFSLAS